MEQIGLILSHIVALYRNQVYAWIALGLLFTVLSIFKSQACNPGKRWWTNPGLKTDIAYGLADKVIGPYLGLPAVFVVHALLSGMMSPAEVDGYFENGSGPLSVLPFWGQVAAYMLIGDFLLYWNHRLFHGETMWRFHAPHHSATEVDWTTQHRFHPVNVAFGSCVVYLALMTLGISPTVVTTMVPFEVLTAAWVHANLNWTLGPLKYVVATPVFHRWHHGPVNEGGNMNFAPTFAFWDVLFGTFYMPANRLPETFGVDEPDYPQTYLGQLIHPFKPKTLGTASAADAPR
jgi:sterol desaturase/sphingolipid hydroxylase (fatty acid hydroxylase superfamily)